MYHELQKAISKFFPNINRLLRNTSELKKKI